MPSTKRDTTAEEGGGRDVLDLGSYVPYFLTAISNTWSRSSSRLYLERFGVGVTEWRVMSQLAIEPGIPAQRICEVIGLDKGAVSRSVATLVAAGHVAERADGRDARRQLLELSASGYALHDRLIAVATQREQVMLEGFSPQERAQLVDFLRRLQARLPELRDFGPPDEAAKGR